MTPPTAQVLVFEPRESTAHVLADTLVACSGGRLTFRIATTMDEAQRLLASQPIATVLIGSGAGEQAFELLTALRRVFPALPVVGLGDARTGERFLREGGQDWVEVASETGADVGEARLIERVLRHVVERGVLLAELERQRRIGLHLAHHDTLTDLPNRQLFRTQLRQLINQAHRHPRALGVMFLDLDRFKQINDTLGHRIGDLLLVAVARRLQGCVRETDIAARRGGDEFTVLLDGIKRGQDAAKVAKKILAETARPYHIDGHELFITASIGISLFPADGADSESLVRNADIAMYRAKARGGNTYQFFMPEMTDLAVERMELENSLHQALERKQFVLYYQPQVDLVSGRIVAMEALIRWIHPEAGMIFPDEFIPLAEETGIIVAMGEWVLGEACRQAKRWDALGLPPVIQAVNFSARQFQFRRPVERIREVLSETGLDPSRLDLELTESALMKDPGFAMETLRKLRDMGVSISIDDFGTGHSSLAYLKRFPINKLKIDKTFIHSLLADRKDAAITNAIISMAHELELKAVAEGVETPEQLEYLRGPGCDEVQGYLFSRPVPADEAARLLASWNTPLN
jgi:diguanylate cyclase (GGDEF)-like protein